VKIIKTMH